MFFFQNLTAELFLLESTDDSYFPKSGGSTFLKTGGTKFGASPPSLTAENPVVFSEHHHPKTLKTL